jgi:hypothetical protein
VFTSLQFLVWSNFVLPNLKITVTCYCITTCLVAELEADVEAHPMLCSQFSAFHVPCHSWTWYRLISRRFLHQCYLWTCFPRKNYMIASYPYNIKDDSHSSSNNNSSSTCVKVKPKSVRMMMMMMIIITTTTYVCKSWHFSQSNGIFRLPQKWQYDWRRCWV